MSSRASRPRVVSPPGHRASDTPARRAHHRKMDFASGDLQANPEAGSLPAAGGRPPPLVPGRRLPDRRSAPAAGTTPRSARRADEVVGQQGRARGVLRIRDRGSAACSGTGPTVSRAPKRGRPCGSVTREATQLAEDTAGPGGVSGRPMRKLPGATVRGTARPAVHRGAGPRPGSSLQGASRQI